MANRTIYATPEWFNSKRVEYPWQISMPYLAIRPEELQEKLTETSFLYGNLKTHRQWAFKTHEDLYDFLTYLKEHSLV